MGNSNIRVKAEKPCVYCYCLLENGTKDHVPPKCIFPKGTPGLITVPSCEICNSRFGKDDEYFRQVIAFAIESSEHPQAKEPIDKALKNFNREESKGFRRKFFETLRLRQVEYEPGVLERGAEYTIELQRIGNVVSRTVRGLLWSESGILSTEDYGVVVNPSFNLDFLGPRQMALIAEVEAMERASSHKRKSIGGGAFEYWWEKRSSDQLPDSVWVLRFYEAIYFVCYVMPAREIVQGDFRRLWEEGLIAVSKSELFVSTLDDVNGQRCDK